MSVFNLVTARKGTPHHKNVTAGTSPGKIADASRNRKCLVIQNLGGEAVFIGDSTVTNSGDTAGYSLASGATFVDNATDTEWWAASSSTDNTLHIIEVD